MAIDIADCVPASLSTWLCTEYKCTFFVTLPIANCDCTIRMYFCKLMQSPLNHY